MPPRATSDGVRRPLSHPLLEPPLEGREVFYLTLTLESLTKESVEERAAVFTEGRRHVVVDLEAVWNVDVEPLRQHLSYIITHKAILDDRSRPTPGAQSTMCILADRCR